MSILSALETESREPTMPLMPQEFWRSHAGQVGTLPRHQRTQQQLVLERLMGQRPRAGFYIEKLIRGAAK
jgi:hypothetical protein